MKALRDVIGKELCWIQPRVLGRSFELKAQDELLGTLSLKGLVGHQAEGECDGRRWRFERRGAMGGNVFARDLRSGHDVATFRRRWRTTHFTFPDGRTLDWRRPGLFSMARQVMDPQGGALVSFSRRLRLFRIEIAVGIDTIAWGRPELPLLVTFGGYLLIESSRRRHAAASG